MHYSTPSLLLHDSQRRSTIPFTPLDPTHVKVYYCGPTVYDLAHIGNLRAMITADILVRLLRHLYPRVTFVRNITDVDDKIITRAQAQKEDISALTRRTTADFHTDLDAVGVLPPDIEPHATDNIAEMQAMIIRLLDNGHAYVADGHVLLSPFPRMALYQGATLMSLKLVHVSKLPLTKNPQEILYFGNPPPQTK